MQKRIVGMHDPCPLELFGGRGGWTVFPIDVGHDPYDEGSKDFRGWAEAGIEPICRFQNAWGDGGGCIPVAAQYGAFAQRIQNFVRESRGCRVWVIGNEFNHAQERPEGQHIWPRDAADCYAQVERLIHSLPGHEDDWVAPGAVAPWNTQTTYPGNETGDWSLYHYHLLEQILARGARVDAICLHAYTHGHAPELVDSDERMSHPWQLHFWHLREFESFVSETPHELWNTPLLITEGNPGANPDPPEGKAWHDVNSGWVQRAYALVDGWNKRYQPQIACLCLYRWKHDEHAIEGKEGVIDDFRGAVAQDYTWGAPGEPPEPPEEDTVINPSFERPYEKQAGTAFVALGWRYWHNQGNPPAEDSQGPLAMPEYKEAPRALDAYRVLEGKSAQCWFIQYKVMDGGIYQVVPAKVGWRYHFDVQAQTWCSNSEDTRAADGEMYLSLGLDPYGRTDPQAQGVVWSPWARVGGSYGRVTSQAVLALGEQMTVYIRAWNKWKKTHNDIYVDDLRWYEEGKTPEPPEPEPPGPDPVEVDYERIATETAGKVLEGMEGLLNRVCDAVQFELGK